MKLNRCDDVYWKALENLISTKKIVVDRKKGSRHPRYPEYVYPVDYGYIEGLKSSDSNDMDVWVGTSKQKTINGVLCTIDNFKNDVEIKILISCMKNEIEAIYDKMNEGTMNAICILRQGKLDSLSCKIEYEDKGGVSK